VGSTGDAQADWASLVPPDFDEPDTASLGVSETGRGSTGASRGSWTDPGSHTGEGADAGAGSGSERAARLLEARRMRWYSAFVGGLVASVIAIVFFLDGDPTARWIHVIGCVLTLGGNAYAIYVTTPLERYQLHHAMPITIASVIGQISGFHFWGELSMVVLMLPVGGFVFGTCARLGPVIIGMTASLLAFWGLLVAIMVGAIDYVGLVRPTFDSAWQITLIASLVTYASVFAVVIARRVGNAARNSLHELEALTSEAARRMALLEEAKAELDRARRVGGPGRYTGQRFGVYELGMLIGTGAMGEVYEARDVVGGDLAAVKLLNMQALGNAQLLERFLRESELIGALDTPNVVRVKPHTDDGPLPYLAMERLIGRSLSDELRRPEGHLTTRGEQLDLIDQVANGLHAAHALGIVHRDIKPGNIYMHRPEGAKPIWKVLDFGISKPADAQETLTQGGVVGTPAYIAPEQAQGREVDHRADLYSLALVAYRVVTGRPAFTGDSSALLLAASQEMPRRPSEVSDVSAAVDSVFAIALAKNPEHRFSSAPSFAKALRAALSETADDHARSSWRARSRRVLADKPWRIAG